MKGILGIVLYFIVLQTSAQMQMQPMRCGTRVPENGSSPSIDFAKEVSTVRLGTYRIPVIFHIVYDYPDDATNVEKKLVDSQLKVLNEDFNRINADTVNTPSIFRTTVGAMQIEFVPATSDPSGGYLNERGIHRVSTSELGLMGGVIAYDYAKSHVQPATIWDPDRYLNIWVMDFDNDYLGASTYPELNMPGLTAEENSDHDGIIIDFIGFGLTEKGSSGFGRTATHEMGHLLGLRHIWGDGDCGADDFVEDTPNADGPNFTCVQSQSCGTQNMVQNYMDYTNDLCMNLFTKGQIDRMEYVLLNAPRRASLLSSDAGQVIDQELTYDQLDNEYTGRTEIPFHYSIDSPLEVEVEVSDTTKIYLEEGVIYVRDTGAVTITLRQEGNSVYNPVIPVSQTFTICQKAQDLIRLDTDSLFVGATFDLFESSLGYPLDYNVSSGNILRVGAGNSFDILQPGLTLVTVQQAGDIVHQAIPAYDTMFCVFPSKPQITIAEEAIGYVDLLADVPVGDVTWYRNGVALSTASVLRVDSSGVYQAVVDVDGCIRSSNMEVEVISPTAIGLPETLRIYPNPVMHTLTIEWPNATETLRIINAIGKEVLRTEIKQGMSTFDLTKLPGGTYLVQIADHVHRISKY